MGNRESKRKLVGPWRNLQVVIWLVGLYILFSRNWFFPGILFLIAVSILYEAFLRRFAPHAFEEPAPLEPPVSTTATTQIPTPVTVSTASEEHRIDLLPSICPNCGGPIRGHEVRWTGAQSANCPYCGTNLPMGKP